MAVRDDDAWCDLLNALTAATTYAEVLDRRARGDPRLAPALAAMRRAAAYTRRARDGARRDATSLR